MSASGPGHLRVLVVANKTWECEPLVNVLLSEKARPALLKDVVLKLPCLPATEAKPAAGGSVAAPPPRPRLTLQFERADGVWQPDTPTTPGSWAGTRTVVSVEVWCIEDWMTNKGSHSSSADKWRTALPAIVSNTFREGGVVQPPDLVVAFGTAGIPLLETANGCVTVGSRVYYHDAFEPRSQAARARRAAEEARVALVGDPPLLRVEELPLTTEDKARRHVFRDSTGLLHPNLFRNLSADLRFAAEARFLPAPLSPATPPRILAGNGHASLGTANITNYDDYIWSDEETRQLFEREVRQREIGSMETTHALIRLAWDGCPFLFVSGLTDRVPAFNFEVTPRAYAQNFAAAHNAGVAVAHLLPDLAAQFGANRLFAPPPPPA